MCLQIGGYTVPAGCMVTIPPFVIDNARWTYGEDAEEFNPSRWDAWRETMSNKGALAAVR